MTAESDVVMTLDEFKSQFLFGVTRNFCSIKVTHFVVGDFNYKNEKLFTWILDNIELSIVVYIHTYYI